MILSIIPLLAGSPGTIANESIGFSRLSNRNSDSRWDASGPWQAKQCVARIGLTSRLKSWDFAELSTRLGKITKIRICVITGMRRAVRGVRWNINSTILSQSKM